MFIDFQSDFNANSDRTILKRATSQRVPPAGQAFKKHTLFDIKNYITLGFDKISFKIPIFGWGRRLPGKLCFRGQVWRFYQ